MNIRNYNIFFHLHTVTGIVISVGLFVIFFAGAFALFEPEIHHWEEKAGVSEIPPIQYEGRDGTLSGLDYDGLLKELLMRGEYLSGRDISFMRTRRPGEITIGLGASADSLAPGPAKVWERYYYDTATREIYSRTEEGFSLGHFFVDLHYFVQLGRFGYYLAGVISFLFLFALVTGVLVHWKKIIGQFLQFRPRAKLKTVWTDAHTALGIIGLPYQLMYALTGAYFCLGILASAPTVLMYGGDRAQYREDFALWPDYPMMERADGLRPVNPYLNRTMDKWPGYEPTYVALKNYGNTNMHLQIDGQVSTQDRLMGFGTIIYHVESGAVVRENDPFHSDYVDAVPKAVWMLHYGEFHRMVGQVSDLFFRTVYFFLALITCFVIITGVLIWLEARNRKNIPERKKRFNREVGYIYLALCLSMLPITALSFIASKIFPESLDTYRDIGMNGLFFIGWLALSLFFWNKRDNRYTNYVALLWGGILALGVPVASGCVSGNWPWHTYALQHYDVFLIDVLWLCIATASLYAVYRSGRRGGKLSMTKKDK